MQYTEITQWLINTGIKEETLTVLVAICILATIVSIARYIFGTKSFGIYAPIILAIAYSYSGLKYGLAITGIVVISTLITYSILKKIRMHYITRMATNYTVIAMALIAFIILANKYNLGFENINQVPALALASIIALSDFFTKQQIKKSLKSTILILTSTILIAAIGWFIITRAFVSQYLAHQILVIPTLFLVNLLIGQFSGLRIKDRIRFRNVIKEEDGK